MLKKLSLLLVSITLTIVSSGCSSAGKIPNVRFYTEIPFLDCPEGAYVESLTKKVGLVSCEEWKKQRPLMIMVDPEGKKEIFGQWSRACRWAGGDCNVQLDSVKETIMAVDKIAEGILKP